MGVVVALDEIEDFGPRVGGVFEDAALEHLELEGADEGLGPRIIVGIGARGHALAQAGGRQGLAKGGAGVLAAAVAMEMVWSTARVWRAWRKAPTTSSARR